MPASTVLIAAGFDLLYRAWLVLYAAQRGNRIATSRPYAHKWHPQYVGFVLILAGFLLQWPILLTAVKFPILVFMYVRLARRGEVEAEARFGDAYRKYAAVTPAFLPTFSHGRQGAAQ